MTPPKLETLLRAAFPEAAVAVVSPDGVHFSARVVDAGFRGLGRVARHQKVYAALGGRVGAEIHALSLEALAPEEA